jgi:hypothetical protein
MFRSKHLLFLALLAVLLAACSKDPIRYRLSQEQLAWQGYRLGEVLRFGHARNNEVRTYQVVKIEDVMETRPGFHLGSRPEYQRISVVVQRTDSITLPQEVLELMLSEYSERGSVQAIAQWGAFSFAALPIDAVNRGTPIDTSQYQYPGARLLRNATFGAVTYASVIQASNPAAPGASSFSRYTRRLYYARGKGVVAFEEANNDLWYRLP